ncbi:guanylate cyclase [Gordonibacter sp. An230]|uniref:guanylate cyclase n=1 Tax=Gordonibacter sp. An230 TaxID=1965592 RepID=UPI000B3A2E79|nr:guanylate cyclase [Gordonibacter sp. An230]OUO92414.1 guanylate cyclase [Gordonibacter sp. An230]
MIARLSRVVPLLLVLAAIALVVYLVVAWRHSPNRGKEVLIRLFTVITSVLSALFLIVCLYAWLDGSAAVLDLGASFLVAALTGLAVTRVCRAVFLRHHPAYRMKPQKVRRLGVLSRFWSSRR